MTASPPSIEPLSAAIVSSTGFPDGTMSQTARGRRRAATKSASESTPAAPNPATRWTASRLRWYATTLWPPPTPRRRRREPGPDAQTPPPPRRADPRPPLPRLAPGAVRDHFGPPGGEPLGHV